MLIPESEASLSLGDFLSWGPLPTCREKTTWEKGGAYMRRRGGGRGREKGGEKGRGRGGGVVRKGGRGMGGRVEEDVRRDK